MKLLMPVALVALLGGCILEGGGPPRQERPDYGSPLSRTDVEKMAKAGVSESVILEKIARAGARTLSPDDLVALKQAGVSDALTRAMIDNVRTRPAEADAETSVAYDYYWSSTWHRSYPSWGPVWWGWGFGLGYQYYGRRSAVGVRIGW